MCGVYSLETRQCRTVGQYATHITVIMNNFRMAHWNITRVLHLKIHIAGFKKNADKQNQLKHKRKSAHSAKSRKNGHLLITCVNESHANIMIAFVKNMRRKLKSQRKCQKRRRSNRQTRVLVQHYNNTQQIIFKINASAKYL